MAYPSPILPKALPSNAKIALISPSARLNTLLPGPLARSVSLFTSLGHTVTTIFINADEDAGLASQAGAPIHASIRNRLAELRAAFSDPSIDAVICTMGGSTMTELIPYLVEDTTLHEAVRQNPKIVVGYSDITVLHWSLRALTGLRTFYGPCPLTEFGDAVASTSASLARFTSSPQPGSKETDDGYLQDFLLANLLATISHPDAPPGPVARSKFYAPLLPLYFLSPPASGPRTLLPSPAWTWLRPGRAEGRLFGGCLTVVARIQGIPWISPDWRGRIIFLETALADEDLTKGNSLGRVQAGIADLVARGVFDEVAGLVIGRPYGYNTEQARAQYAAAFRGLLCHGLLAERKFPILMNVDIGHTTPMVTLPMDALARLDSEKDEFSIIEAVVA